MVDFAWQPTGNYLHQSRVREFMDLHGISSWQDLIARSTRDTEWFWNAALTHLGLEWFEPYTRLYDDSLGMPWTRWFLGGKLNIVHNCLDRHIRDGRGAAPALWFEADDGSQSSLTYAQLYASVNALAHALKRMGVRKGDRVALCMPISPEAVTVMFATFKIGAVCMQFPARLAPQEIAPRLQEAAAQILFLNDGYMRGGKLSSCEGIYKAVMASAPAVNHIVVVERLGNGLAQHPKCLSWDECLKPTAGADDIETEILDSEHPALILYSSGTTGKSKTVIHTHGGALAQVTKEIGYNFDCRAADVFYWFTNIGWMMAPWEFIGALFFGASVVLYEGTHLFPSPHRLFEILHRYGISIFGCTPSVLRELATLNLEVASYNLSALRILGSTGSPLDAATWWWFFKTFGQERCPIMNISGGTELIGSLVCPLPVMPLKPATAGGPGLAMDIDVVDAEGRPVRGEPGYLVCRKPFPSMTRGFLGDSELYLRTYFPNGPDRWVHGDLARIDADGYWYMLGRSDDLIVRAGVKHDPAKLEAMLLEFPGPPRIREAVAIGVEDPARGKRIICLVVLQSQPGGALEALPAQLKTYIKQNYDPLGQPDEIHVVSQLPLNLSSKIPRNLIRLAYEDKTPGSIGPLANPEALEEIRELGKEGRRLKTS